MASHTGQLGESGNSIGYRNATNQANDRLHRLKWSWGGGGEITLEAGFDRGGGYATRPTDIRFEVDFSAGTVDVYLREDSQPFFHWATIPGLPAGTYHFAAYTAGEINARIDPTIPDGWTATI